MSEITGTKVGISHKKSMRNHSGQDGGKGRVEGQSGECLEDLEARSRHQKFQQKHAL